MPKGNALEFGPKSAAWLAVSKADVDARGPASWWCASKEAQPGDVLILYQCRRGLARVERLTGPAPTMEPRCADVGLRTVLTEFVFRIKVPVTLQELKEHPDLREMSAVRRSFQGTFFPVAPASWRVLRKLLESRATRD